MTDREKYNWRQDTPQMQLVALTQAIWGTSDNLREGLTTGEKAADYLEGCAERLAALAPYLRKGSW